MPKHPGKVMPTEADFRAESDVHTLKDAMEIMKDKPRFNRALKKAKEKRSEMDTFIDKSSGLRTLSSRSK